MLPEGSILVRHDQPAPRHAPCSHTCPHLLHGSSSSSSCSSLRGTCYILGPLPCHASALTLRLPSPSTFLIRLVPSSCMFYRFLSSSSLTAHACLFILIPALFMSPTVLYFILAFSSPLFKIIQTPLSSTPLTHIHILHSPVVASSSPLRSLLLNIRSTS